MPSQAATALRQPAPPRRRHLAQRLAQDLLRVMDQAQAAESLAAGDGLLQRLDPRIKLSGALALIVSAVLTHSLGVVVGLFALALLLAWRSQLLTAGVCQRLWLSVLLFSGTVALPALVLVPGDALWQLPLPGWAVSEQGLRSAALLIARAETSATLALLLIVSTPWTHVLKAMRCLGAPRVLVAILGMTHRYLFVLAQTATQLFEARRSRIVAPMNGAQQRALATSAAGVVLGKTFWLASEVHLAMISRGYRGEVRLLDDFHTRARDWLALLGALSVPLLILWGER